MVSDIFADALLKIENIKEVFKNFEEDRCYACGHKLKEEENKYRCAGCGKSWHTNQHYEMYFTKIEEIIT